MTNLSFNIENEINNYRNQLKSQNINDVNNHLYTYAIGTMYMDTGDMMSPAQKIFPISYRNLLTEIRSLSCWI